MRFALTALDEAIELVARLNGETIEQVETTITGMNQYLRNLRSRTKTGKTN
jgi:hypothetical protein